MQIAQNPQGYHVTPCESTEMPSPIDNISLRIIESLFVRSFLRILHLLLFGRIIRRGCLFVLILHRLIDAIAKETGCKNYRRDSYRFQRAHFVCPPLLYRIRNSVASADMALYATAVPAAFAIHPRANSAPMPIFAASMTASIFAPKKTNSQPYFSF